jgi:hypothetical protein
MEHKRSICCTHSCNMLHQQVYPILTQWQPNRTNQNSTLLVVHHKCLPTHVPHLLQQYCCHAGDVSEGSATPARPYLRVGWLNPAAAAKYPCTLKYLLIYSCGALHCCCLSCKLSSPSI